MTQCDYERYLSFLSKYSEEKETAVLAYCLMPNHIHLLIRPTEAESLPKMMQGVTLCYTKYFNGENGRTGRLWECRYYSTVVDEDSYLWTLSSYIENNPVRARMVRRAEDYPYSSAKAHLLGKKDPLLKEPLFGKDELNAYREFIHLKRIKRLCRRLESRRDQGSPLATEDFSTPFPKNWVRACLSDQKEDLGKNRKMVCVPFF